MNKTLSLLVLAIAFVGFHVQAKTSIEDPAINNEIVEQRLHLKENIMGKGYGPQSPRNIDSVLGKNKRSFGAAPAYSEMNLCNIHFHENAEHAGGQFTKYAGPGDGHGHHTGYVYSGELSKSESKPVKEEICPSVHGSLQSGETIEVHYVYTTALVKPGPTLGACFSDAIRNPQIRVEAEVYVLVNDSDALDFVELNKVSEKNGFYQALNIPDNTGEPIVYNGSTTGPDYNETGSPYEVTWSVHPNIAKVDIKTVGEWCKGNVFNEDHAHGVRNLVIEPDFLAPIK